MAKLYFWIAEAADNQCYSIIGKTKKEVQAKLEAWGEYEDYYDVPVRKVISYSDAFDLFDYVTSEAGGRACGRNTKEC